eukprot:CAMPEP_0184741266 /NCGR_PEP_ID=MMETSP0315-20130426/4301_1 /TAXON_ID=101924 /ORGANISM="Rhodosorus marinus, Strain UTEX LB 2760" /LENGTH=317 /DNA_ID=CAMNT_0027211449 /DNA_START=318 /DNA_END=1271 /DNA_ORIENTATION=-
MANVGVRWGADTRDVVVVGRELEMKAISIELGAGNSVLVVGEPGTGRRSIVHATEKVAELNWSKLAAEAGSFEEFLTMLESHLEKSDKVFINGLDLLLALSEHPTLLYEDTFVLDGMPTVTELIRKTINHPMKVLVGTISEKELERTTNVTGRVKVVRLSPMSVERTIDVLRKKREEYELKFNVLISENAVETAVNVTESYMPSGLQPLKAVDVLLAACKVAVGGNRRVTDESVLCVVSAWTRIPRERLRDTKGHRQKKVLKRVASVGNLKRASSMLEGGAEDTLARSRTPIIGASRLSRVAEEFSISPEPKAVVFM